ncbi:MAG: UPF0149 family protein [Proteobacteria bacterium]|nr:UPF0149 family protein [Pseudomonadota bacterium]
MADLEALAIDAAVGISAAELHGAVCGIAVASGDAFHINQLLDLVGEEALSDGMSVGAFVEAALTDLLADDFRFSLLLPADDEPLKMRVDALANWCAAFTSAVAAGVADTSGDQPLDLSKEAEGILDDMLAIANIERVVDEDEESESELVELVEFVKVGVLLLQNLVRDGDSSE